MADHAAGDDFFVYTGGQAPQHVMNAIIDESVDKIDDDAFSDNLALRSVVCHDGLLRIGKGAFHGCIFLQRMNVSGVKIIEQWAFYWCKNLTHVDLDKLESVGDSAFRTCISLQRVKLPKVKTIGTSAFRDSGVDELELLGEDLQTIGSDAFRGSKLRRIAIPLKNNMFQMNDADGTYNQFVFCHHLTTVDLVGGIHKTVASLHLESWRNEVNEEIQRINQILPGTAHYEKTDVIRQWMQSVIRKIDHYKAEHSVLAKEVATLLELALWKAKLDDFKVDDGRDSVEEVTVKKAKIDDGEARKEARITSGADIIIKNVLPYLKME